MNSPFDQDQRTRFITGIEHNFSVIASAGSGKTRAITDRIVEIARSPQAIEWLPTLFVVTYTNRAAGEMQQRARQSILESDLPVGVVTAFNRAFFGTIHSLCMKLLRQYGHHLGLPAALDHLDDDDALWMEFVQQHTSFGEGLPEEHRRALQQLAPVNDLLELGRSGTVLPQARPPGPLPPIDLEAILAFVGKGTSRGTVARTQEALRRWEREWASGGFAPLPHCEAKPLRETWDAAMQPWCEWVREAALFTAAQTSEAYRRFRIARGAITYDDQIALAEELLRNPEAAARIRAKNPRIILDEAQDTDPGQFDVLLEMARPAEARGAWLETRLDGPRAGHFCMVGDFQQSIFGDRADLPHYRTVHETLIETGCGEAVKFSVTFRLDQQPLDHVNAIFARVLDGLESQVSFVELHPRPAVLPGQILRCELDVPPETSEWNRAKKWRYEARELARWMKRQGLEKLRAESWSDVAILAPRTLWFPALRDALRAEGIASQVQSERSIKGDSPAYAWFTALVVIMAEPRDSYEIVGVLREVFGLADHDLASFAEGHGERFHIAAPTTRRGPIGETLNQLADLRSAIEALPLYSAISELVRGTQLRERLLTLPAEEFDNLSPELDDLLTAAAQSEAMGGTLGSFAEELRSNFTKRRDTRAVTRDAVQLITAHKAKGSEWQVVILPGLARDVNARSAPYPRIVEDPHDGRPVALLSGEDLEAELKERQKAEVRHEFERLLYVAFTRARHTLVLVQDHALFATKRGLPQSCAARYLGEDVIPSAAFLALPTQAVACPSTAQHQAERREQRSQARTVPALTVPPAGFVAAARENATAFLKRNPSALAEAAGAEADPIATVSAPTGLPSLPNAGQLYGTWWHEFVEEIDWSAEPATWDERFEAQVAHAPDAKLARREWQQLRETLIAPGPLHDLLCAPETVAHAELPFLWAMSERECLDGIIDLAVFDPSRGSWLILDWKTNRTSPLELPALRAHYLPQLSAYWRAASAMLGAPVSAGIYSTATGEWLPYEEAELRGAWAKISADPAELELILADD